LTRQTQTILYHLLPVAIWLLAAVGAVLPCFLIPSLVGEGEGRLVSYFVPAFLALFAVMVIGHISRHASAVEPSFLMAVFLGIASCWLPTVVFVVVPVWFYLAYRHLFNMRVFTASLVGLALVALWMAVCIYLEIMEIPSFEGREGVGLLSWIPTGAFLFAYIASTIARQTLRVR